MRDLKSYIGIGLVLAALAINICSLTGAPAPLELLSARDANLSAAISGNGNSLAPTFTADGTKLIFISQAANLVTNDHNGSQSDIFIHNLADGMTKLVSLSSSNGTLDLPVASGNGNRIAFMSTGTDFGVADTNDNYDIVWRDLDAKVTRVLSVGTNGAGNNLSINPSISADGRWVAFESLASNLVTNDNNGLSDIYLRDTETDTTILVSLKSDRLRSVYGDSQNPIISANGKKVAYTSKITFPFQDYIVKNTNNHSSDLYVFDVDILQNKMVKLAPTNISGVTSLNVTTFNHALSADGRYVAFQANHAATNHIKAGIYWVDLETDTVISFDQKWDEKMGLIDPPVEADISTTNMLGLTDLSGPSISADGQVLAFEANYHHEGQILRNVWVWWPESDEIRRLTNSVSGSMTNRDVSPSISADGRYVVAHSTETGLFVTDLSDFSTKEGLGNDDLPGAVLSPDGSLLAFQTRTEGLVTNENNGAYDVFIRDLTTDDLTLISAHAVGLESITSIGWNGFVPRGISDDGRYVVFTSSAALTTNDHNGGKLDVFVRDLEVGSTELISVDFTGTHSGNGNSFNPSMSADGRYVVFESYATNLVEADRAVVQKIFLRDRETNSTRPLSRPLEYVGERNSFGSAISADGGHVIFQSHHQIFGGGDSGPDRDTFMYDVGSGKVSLTSSNLVGPTSGEPNPTSAISADGSLVMFREKLNSSTYYVYLYGSVFTNLQVLTTNTPANAHLLINRQGTRAYISGSATQGVLSYDVASQTLSTITNTMETSHRSARKRLAASADGRYLGFSTPGDLTPLDFNSINDVYIYDFATHENILVSINKDANGAGNGISDNVSISLDGRFVAFQSTASNLVEGDDNNASDIFVRDLELNTTTRVSSGPGPHYNPLISADGRVVVFSSGANNPAFGDFNNSTDAYAVRLTVDNGPADSDSDGMTDLWELTMFGDLARDGSGDADQDSLSDLNEFRAGTHPLDDQSTFAGQILTPAGDGSVSIAWQVVAGKTYRVEYRNSLTEGEWTVLDAAYSVAGSTATAVDVPPAGTEQRYYRVVIVEAP